MKKNEEINKLIAGRFKSLMSELVALDKTYTTLNSKRIEMGNKLEGYKNAKTEINDDIMGIFKDLAESNSTYVKLGQAIDNYMNKIKEVYSIITITGIEANLSEEENLILKDCLENIVENFVVDGDKVVEKDYESDFIKELYTKAVEDTISNYKNSYNQMIGNA